MILKDVLFSDSTLFWISINSKLRFKIILLTLKEYFKVYNRCVSTFYIQFLIVE